MFVALVEVLLRTKMGKGNARKRNNTWFMKPPKIWFKVAEAEIRHRDISRDIQAWLTYTVETWKPILWYFLDTDFLIKNFSAKMGFGEKHFRRKIFWIKNSCDFSHARAKPETHLNKYSKMYTSVTAKSDVDF